MKTAKINRYQQWVSHFQQNRVFRNNDSQFYKQIGESEKGEETVIPDGQEAKTFWTDVWGQEVEHNKNSTWLREIKKDMNGKNEEAPVHILQEKLKKILKKIPCILKKVKKAPGPDGVQGF